MAAIHPGKLFLEKYGQIRTSQDVFAYGDFLRTDAGIDNVLPVDLEAIFSHFELPQPKYVPLGDIQALLFEPQSGFILVNSEDPKLRQRFSLAHELVELLFSELSKGVDIGNGWSLERPGGFQKFAKERLCNQTAANLLMPVMYIQQQIHLRNVNFECARLVANECKVSLSAALVQLARNSLKKHAVIFWRMKNKPVEVKQYTGPNQLPLFQSDNDLPPKKLRVEWFIGGDTAPFIPKDKSTENTSIVYRAWEQGIFTSGKERMTFDNRNSAWYFSENMPFDYSGERGVISLVERLE